MIALKKTTFFALVFVLLISACGLFARSKADSLVNALEHLNDDKERVDILNKLSYELNYADFGKAKGYAVEAIRTGQIIKYHSGVARAYRNLAIVHQNMGEYGIALTFADSASAIFQSVSDSLGLASVFTTVGNINYYLADFAKALDMYEKAYEIYLNQNHQSRAAIILSNVALVLGEMSNYQEALNRYFEALSINEKTGDEAGKALTLRSIGMGYFNLGNFDKAIEYYFQSLEICKQLGDEFGIAAAYGNIGNAYGMKGDSQEAMPYFIMALEIFQDKNDLNSTAIVYSQIGHYLIKDGQEQQGLEFLNKSITINRETGNRHSLAYVLNEVAMIEISRGMLDLAYAHLLQCEEIFKATSDLNMLSQTYNGFSRYYEKTGDYQKSLTFHKQYKQLQDSIFRVESEERIANAELRYNAEKSKAENARLTGDNILKELEAQKHKHSRNVILAAAVLIFIAALGLFYRYTVKKKIAALLERQNSELSEKNQQIGQQKGKIETQYKKLQELDEAKTRFFANISHELRTPLTLIQGPLEDVIKSDEAKNLTEATHFKIRLAHRNIRQLNNLVVQLLDLSKLKAGKLKLKVQKQDIVTYLKRTVNTFESAIPEHKSIKISFRSQSGQLFLYFDPEKMDQIFNNLISNAIKSIEQDGEIIVNLEAPRWDLSGENAEGEFVTISITDTGKGISKADLPKIFNRFFRADDSGTQNEQGTGIGLELTRDLLELHGGTISAESEPAKGSVFTIQMPLGKAHLEPEEIVEDEIKSEHFPLNIEKEELPESEASAAGNQSKHTILIVEDHPEMRQYIIGHLSGRFNILEASNGKEALELINRQRPGLIVSDLMMPEMDGLSLLQELRKHISTADIPFIMLTAKASEEDRLAGFQMKADAYITKPFQAGELLVRIQNLLERSASLKEKYSKKVLTIELDKADIPTADQKFLQQLKKAVEENLSDPTFGIQQLSDKAYLSERQVRRKLNDLTGLTPVDFIRQIRLQQAKLLIEQHAFTTIAEVATAVGFNNPAYFTRLFKKLFGSSPQEILKTD
jgi:signal transduction histidine kinase/DNA-binding response OmpR family regulator